MSSCLDKVINPFNPTDLLSHAVIPAAAGAVASYFVGTYQPDPAVPARSFRPLTAALFTGTQALFTQLAMNGICKIYHQVSHRDVFNTFGSATGFIFLGAGIAALTARHIIPRDIAAAVTGEQIDIINAAKIGLATTFF